MKRAPTKDRYLEMLRLGNRYLAGQTTARIELERIAEKSRTKADRIEVWRLLWKLEREREERVTA